MSFYRRVRNCNSYFCNTTQYKLVDKFVSVKGTKENMGLMPWLFGVFFALLLTSFPKTPPESIGSVHWGQHSESSPSLFGYPDMIHVGTTTTADNCFSYLKRLCHSTWTKNICHVVGSGLTIIRPGQWRCQF